ncbi:hypothetical protein IMSHALPRED_009475 [Imshaugia aleurites]|uniref:Uncharacterized protein n=1 Tax=Imshaugia aleurites TaxID=172621 RepID=A0A8H3G0Z5_9LECA|nr:hypothetical protein IMSHALPRED_009475 [Imshaugia aleurites]
MGTSKSSASHRSKRTTSHKAKKAVPVQSILHHNVPTTEPPNGSWTPEQLSKLSQLTKLSDTDFLKAVRSLVHLVNVSATEPPKPSWTPEQLSDTDFLKVPISAWKAIHKSEQTQYIAGADNLLTPALAAGTLLSPTIVLGKVPKWFWDCSVETKDRKDTYRYRVIDADVNISILPLPEDDGPDLMDDDSMIKILSVGLPFKDHLIMLLRRICPDPNMDPIKNEDEWEDYLAPSIRQGFYAIRRSTTHGWAHTVKRKKGRRY